MTRRLALEILERYPAPVQWVLVPAAILAALAVLAFLSWALRQIALPLLLVGTTAYVLLRRPGPTTRSERVARRTVILLGILVTVGPIFIPLLRWALFAMGAWAWFKLAPVGGREG